MFQLNGNQQGTKRMPIKVQGDADKRIDGAVTILIAYETLNRYKKDYMDIVVGGEKIGIFNFIEKKNND